MTKIYLALNNYHAGSGKDTVADFLVDNYDFKKYSLSEWIYEIAWSVYGIERGTKPPRKLLHHIGESLREYDKMVWLKKTLHEIKRDGFERVVITDVRKGIEHFFLKEHGFINVKVFCEESVAIERMKNRDGKNSVDMQALNASHESEVKNLDMKVINNSDKWEVTVEQIDELIKNIVNEK